MYKKGYAGNKEQSSSSPAMEQYKLAKKKQECLIITNLTKTRKISYKNFYCIFIEFAF